MSILLSKRKQKLKQTQPSGLLYYMDVEYKDQPVKTEEPVIGTKLTIGDLLTKWKPIFEQQLTDSWDNSKSIYIDSLGGYGNTTTGKTMWGNITAQSEGRVNRDLENRIKALEEKNQQMDALLKYFADELHKAQESIKTLTSKKPTTRTRK